MKKWISIAIFALLVAAAATAQMAPPAGPHPGRVLADYLQLTPEQITTWQQIDRETATAVQPLVTHARDLRPQLDTAMKAAAPDATAIGNLALSLHAVRAQIQGIRETAKNKRLATLTADQKAKFDAFQAAAQFMRQQRRAPLGMR
jgi:Spy/CpxP family protein refolding chaperone